jgi:hypothetical protein
MKRLGAILATLALTALVGAGSAAATTFCVPDFGPNCPRGGGNVAEADLEKAMGLNARDGTADTIIIAAGTYTDNGTQEPVGWEDPNNYAPEGSDALTIVGAGPAGTVVTSGGGGNIFLINFGSNNSRAITMRDLTIQVPATFTDGLGSAIQLSRDDILDNVDIVSLNDGSDGVIAFGARNVFRNGEVRGGGADGTIDYGLSASGAGSALLVEDAITRSASWALVANDGGNLTARRVSEIGTGAYGAIASGGFSGGGSLLVENSVMTIDDGVGLYVSSTDDDVSLTANHVTVVNTGGSTPALEGKKFSSSAGDAAVTASNSIFRGFTSGYRADTPIGPGVGFVSVRARYSNVLTTGTNTNGQIDFSTGNTSVDPLLNADFSLPPNSPAVDAGDPASGGLTTDFLNVPRPVDGDGNGSAIRDMGAFEYQPPVIPSPGSPIDRDPPQTKLTKVRKSKFAKALARGKARFGFQSSEQNSTFVCKLDRRRVAACRSPKRYRGLREGRHLFKVWAIDAAGNRDPTPAKKRFRVP